MASLGAPQCLLPPTPGRLSQASGQLMGEAASTSRPTAPWTRPHGFCQRDKETHPFRCHELELPMAFFTSTRLSWSFAKLGLRRRKPSFPGDGGRVVGTAGGWRGPEGNLAVGGRRDTGTLETSSGHREDSVHFQGGGVAEGSGARASGAAAPPGHTRTPALGFHLETRGRPGEGGASGLALGQGRGSSPHPPGEGVRGPRAPA